MNFQGYHLDHIDAGKSAPELHDEGYTLPIDGDPFDVLEDEEDDGELHDEDQGAELDQDAPIPWWPTPKAWKHGPRARIAQAVSIFAQLEAAADDEDVIDQAWNRLMPRTPVPGVRVCGDKIPGIGSKFTELAEDIGGAMLCSNSFVAWSSRAIAELLICLPVGLGDQLRALPPDAWPESFPALVAMASSATPQGM